MNTTRIAVREALTEHPAGVPVIVGVSGGSDSMALAATVAFVAPKLGIPVHAVCVDHRLRPESAAEARFVVDELRSRGVIVHVARVAVSGELGQKVMLGWLAMMLLLAMLENLVLLVSQLRYC